MMLSDLIKYLSQEIHRDGDHEVCEALWPPVYQRVRPMLTLRETDDKRTIWILYAWPEELPHK
jgi:hypothetical protein